MLDSKLNLPKLSEELTDLFPESPHILAWTPKSDNVCSSSIAKYFNDAGRNVRLLSNRLKVENIYGLKFPEIHSDCDDHSFAEISECISMNLLGCSTEQSDLSSFCYPDGCVDIGRGRVIHAKGLITQHVIQRLFTEIRKIVNENDSFPWVAISLIPNSTSPEASLVVVSTSSVVKYEV